MNQPIALPFTLRRNDSVVDFLEVVSTSERVHGHLLLAPDAISIQWRVSRDTQRVGLSVRTEHEVEPIREVKVPCTALTGATVRWSWRWPPGRYLVLTSGDMHTFEDLVGCPGISIPHPAQIMFRIGRSHYLTAREFASDLQLAIADHTVAASDPPPVLGEHAHLGRGL